MTEPISANIRLPGPPITPSIVDLDAGGFRIEFHEARVVPDPSPPAPSEARLEELASLLAGWWRSERDRASPPTPCAPSAAALSGSQTSSRSRTPSSGASMPVSSPTRSRTSRSRPVRSRIS